MNKVKLKVVQSYFCNVRLCNILIDLQSQKELNRRPPVLAFDYSYFNSKNVNPFIQPNSRHFFKTNFYLQRNQHNLKNATQNCQMFMIIKNK